MTRHHVLVQRPMASLYFRSLETQLQTMIKSRIVMDFLDLMELAINVVIFTEEVEMKNNISVSQSTHVSVQSRAQGQLGAFSLKSFFVVVRKSSDWATQSTQPDRVCTQKSLFSPIRFMTMLTCSLVGLSRTEICQLFTPAYLSGFRSFVRQRMLRWARYYTMTGCLPC